MIIFFVLGDVRCLFRRVSNFQGVDTAKFGALERPSHREKIHIKQIIPAFFLRSYRVS